MGDGATVERVGSTLYAICTRVSGTVRNVRVTAGTLSYEVDTLAFRDESELGEYLQSKQPGVRIIPGQ